MPRNNSGGHTGRPGSLPRVEVLLQLEQDHHPRSICPMGDQCPGVGHSRVEIAEMYAVSKGAVSNKLRPYGYTKHRPTYSDLLPWTVADEHRMDVIASRLRDIGRWREAGGISAIPASRRKPLRDWMQYMEDEDLVVIYHPSTGFLYDHRRPGDEKFVRPPKNH